MYILLILSLVTSLVIISINARYSLDSYTNGYWSKDLQTTRFHYQESNINEAINALCRVDLSTCKSFDDGTGELVFTLSDLASWSSPVTIPSSFSGFERIKITSDKKNIVFEHSITDLDRRTEYINSSLGLHGTISCSDGSTIPCTGATFTKTITLSPETRIVFVEDRLLEIEDLLSDPDITDDESDALNSEKDQLQNEQAILTTTIENREDLIP